VNFHSSRAGGAWRSKCGREDKAPPRVTFVLLCLLDCSEGSEGQHK
jgi:hypothetical protein